MKRIALLLLFGISYTVSFAQGTIVETLRQQPNLTVFTKLVEACNLTDELNKVRDEVYEEKYLSGEIKDLQPFLYNYSGAVPEHRYYGFTLFPETDAFWEQTLNKTAANISVADVESWASTRGQSLYDFVRYHILPLRLSPDKLVIHYNERGYNYRSSKIFTIPVYEIYESLGGGQLLKLYQCGPNHSIDGTSDIFINRTPVLNDGRHGNLAEISVTPQTEGIRLDTTLAVKSLNGYIYPITAPLIYDENVREQVLGGRLRYDIAALFPELMNNDIRANKDQAIYCGLPNSQQYRYCEGLDIDGETKLYFLSGLGQSWLNWQGDEFSTWGQSDFTIKLPPVPTDGEYELRLGYEANSGRHSAALFYIGKDKNNLEATGLPIDQRQLLTAFMSWGQETGDDVIDRSNNLQLYEAGVMRAPANYHDLSMSRMAYQAFSNLRRIIWRGDVEAGQTYYMRVRSTDGMQATCHLDYLEWCPKSVYNNPDKPEDIW